MREPERRSPAAVLIADDAAHVRRLCAQVLETHGFRVLEAEDGPAAVEMFRHHRPDVVLLDLEMPGGGLDALAAIRATDAGARVVMLTGRSDRETVKAALALGVGDYVVKPFSRQRLLAAVERVLGA